MALILVDRLQSLNEMISSKTNKVMDFWTVIPLIQNILELMKRRKEDSMHQTK